MIKIRLSRIGARNRPSYRIVAVETRSKRNGKPLAIIGLYDGKNNPPTVKVDKTLLDSWLKKGAQLNPAVKKILS